jgi:hypothetical protein
MKTKLTKNNKIVLYYELTGSVVKDATSDELDQALFYEYEHTNAEYYPTESDYLDQQFILDNNYNYE